MKTENTTTKPKKWKKILKYLFIGLFSLIVILLVWNWLWINSGSNRWELKMDKDGVKIYTLKSPGDKFVKFKSSMRGNYTLSQLAASHIIDHNLETCKEWFPNCIECRTLEPFDTLKLYDVTMWTLTFPGPFSSRELLIKTMVSQNKDKVVTIDVVGVPNAIAPTDKIVRVERMHNVWKFTPLGNGQSECECLQDIDLGGFFPYFLMNMAGLDATYTFMHDELPKFLDKDRYRNAHFAFIKE